MKQSLDFKEFGPCEPETWIALVSKELGDKPFESLIWKDENGLSLQPYYSDRGQQLLSHGSPKTNWQIAQSFGAQNDRSWNESILNALAGGVQFLVLDFKGRSDANLDVILKDVLIDIITIRFINNPEPLSLLKQFYQLATGRGIDTKALKGSVLSDHTDISSFVAIAEFCNKYLPAFHAIEIDGVSLHNRGANAVLEVAAVLHEAHQQLFALMESGITASEANDKLFFSFGIGSSYFVEMAKLRVFRELWSFILSSYDSALHDAGMNVFVYAETSARNQVVADIHNNLLRATTQSMSAILGGADALNTIPYNAVAATDDVNSMRLARNIQHLLIEESYLNESREAVNGSYYIGEVEKQLTEKIWMLFKELESKGDRAQKFIQEQVILQSEERNKEIEDKKRVVVGLNKYQQATQK